MKEDQIIQMEPVPKQHAHNVELFKRAIEHKGLSVILARRACVQVGRKLAKKSETKKKEAAPA